MQCEFTRLVEEGEASDAFLALLDSDPDCRRACEMVLRADRDLPRLVSDETEGVSEDEQEKQNCSAEPL